jgi:hypothetical protein
VGRSETHCEEGKRGGKSGTTGEQKGEGEGEVGEMEGEGREGWMERVEMRSMRETSYELFMNSN